MAEQTLADKLAEYEKLSGSTKDVPEAGAGHYLARGALQGISALADLVPNLYNLQKAEIGVSPIPTILSKITGKPRSDFMPEVGKANPIGNFLLENYGLNEPVRASNSIGGNLGGAALEGLGGAVAQGPMGLAKAAPQAMAMELLKQEAKNAALGGLAGAGAEVGGEATGGSGLGSLAGGLVAGVVAPATFIRGGGVTIGAIRAAKKTAEEIRSEEAMKGAADKIQPAFTDYVGSTLKGAVSGTPNAASNLTEGLGLRSAIPGFNPSVAEMANSPGLIDIQKKFALLNPRNLNAEVARTEGNAQAVQDYYRSQVPAAETPSAVRSAVNQSLADYEKLVASQAKGVADQLPVADQVAVGTTLSDAAKAEKLAAKPAIEAAYTKAYDLAPESVIDAKPVIAKIEETLGVPISKLKPETAPNTFAAIKRFIGGEGGMTPEETALRASEVGGTPPVAGARETLTLAEAAALRQAVGADAALAQRSTDPLAATRLRNIAGVKGSIDEAIAGSPVSQEAKDAFAAANKKYETEFAPRFKEGTNLRVFKDSSLNEPRILPDKMVSEYFKPDAQGGGTRVGQFAQLFGKNQEAKDAAKQGILDIYRQKVVDPVTGAIKPDAHAEFVRDYGRTLQQFKNVGVNAGEDIHRIAGEAAKVGRTMSNFQDLAKTLKFDTVGDLADAALASPKTMGNVISRIDASKREVLNTVLLDKAFEKGTAAGMRDFLEKNQQTLRMTVPKEQLSAMNDIAKALEMTERAPIRGNIAAGGADMLKNATGTSTATVFSQIRAVTGGRSSVEWAAINLAMPALNKMTQTSFANVMENALHSPESAVALRNYLMSNSPSEANRWAARVLDSMKAGGKLVWSAKGPITKNFLGPQQYPENLGRAGTAIRSQLPKEQDAR